VPLSKRRVVVTGLGIVSPVGNDITAAWDSIVGGRSGIGPVTRFEVSTFPTHFGGEIRNLDL
jgi:3-oxoacyl-[acyl-carrier-protein] synthase II